MKRWALGAALVAMIATAGVGELRATGIPVLDVANLEQQVVTSIEEVSQTLKQIEEYALQLQQFETQLMEYQNMVLNTTGLATIGRIYNQATAVMDKINGLSNILDGQKAKLGSLDRVLERFKDPSKWSNTTCLGTGGCSSAQKDEIIIHWNDNTTTRYDANNAVLRGADEQATSIQSDAKRLESLQDSLHGAQGQVANLQANGQIGAAQADQLLKIRALLVSQANAQAIRDQAELDREAANDAADRNATSGTFVYGARKKW